MNRFNKLFMNLPDDAECVLITSDVNRRYFTGMKSSAGTVLAFRNGENYLIIDFRYIEKARKTASYCEVIEQDRLYHQIYEILKKHNAKKVYVESHTMTLEELAKIKNALKNVQFDTSDKLSRAIFICRTIKEPEEIEKIVEAQRIAEEALEKTFEIISVGVTEREIALELDYNMRKLGAEDLSFETIALSGKNTSMPHGVPSEKRVQEHEFVLMDFGAVVDGYHSDMTRTVCVGEPTEKMREVYNIVLEAQKASLEKARSGITGYELDAAAREYIESKGYGKAFGHSLGHGVGMEIHEFPNASPLQKNTILEENNIVTVEPGIYIPNEFGVRIEDFVVIKHSGCFNMTNAEKKLIIL